MAALERKLPFSHSSFSVEWGIVASLCYQQTNPEMYDDVMIMPLEWLLAADVLDESYREELPWCAFSPDFYIICAKDRQK